MPKQNSPSNSSPSNKQKNALDKVSRSASSAKERVNPQGPHFIDALSYILASAQCSTKYHSYLYNLIGISDGWIEFKAADREVIQRMTTSEDQKTLNDYKKRLKNKRKSFEQWQRERGIIFVNRSAGGRKPLEDMQGQMKYYPTEYNMPLLLIIDSVILKAQENSELWNGNPKLAIKQAAEEEIRALMRDAQFNDSHQSKEGKPWIVEVNMRLGQSLTIAREILGIMPSGAELFGKPKVRLLELKKLLSQIPLQEDDE